MSLRTSFSFFTRNGKDLATTFIPSIILGKDKSNEKKKRRLILVERAFFKEQACMRRVK